MRRINSLLAAVITLGAATATAFAQHRVGYLTLEDSVSERHATAGFLSAPSGLLLRDVISTFESIANDNDLKGLVIRVKDMPFTRTQIEEIAPALSMIRASGKKIHIFTENYGTLEFLLGAHADELLMQTGGSATLTGLYMEELFLADALRKFGIEPSFVQVGDYKGADEMFAKSAPSPQWEENINGLLDGLYHAMLDELAKGRGKTRPQIERAMGELFFADGARAIANGMLSAEIDRLELDEHLAKHYGDDFIYEEDLWITSEEEAPDFSKMGLFEAFGTIMRMLNQPALPDISRDTIAIVHIDGAIVDGESSPGGFFGESTVGALTIREVLREIEEEPLIRGVVIRIDSPGGSATASEAIWQGIDRLKASGKPVWVSVGSMAASGGYYIAVAGDRIYMNPSSIVGSIGVVAGKMGIAGLYEKLGITAVPRSRGPRSNMFGGLEPWTPDERALVRQRMIETYDLFSTRVRSGRPGIDLSKAGEGRLFAANRAVELRMVDAVGGLDRTVKDMAMSIGLASDAYDLRDYPAPKSFEEVIEEMFGFVRVRNIGSELALGAVNELGQEVLGPQAWRQLASQLEAMMQLRNQPVVLTAPRAVIVR